LVRGGGGGGEPFLFKGCAGGSWGGVVSAGSVGNVLDGGR